MARGRSISRSASSGRFVSRSAAARRPSRTTTERVGGGSHNTRSVSRSAATGRFVKAATVQRHPESTITQRAYRSLSGWPGKLAPGHNKVRITD